MVYIYYCKKCEKNYELEKLMSEDFTSDQLTCKVCRKNLVRDHAKEKSSIIIPEPMRAEYVHKDMGLKFDKSPSGRKHYW